MSQDGSAQHRPLTRIVLRCGEVGRKERLCASKARHWKHTADGATWCNAAVWHRVAGANARRRSKRSEGAGQARRRRHQARTLTMLIANDCMSGL